jgi:hypothetical protein
MAQRIINAVNIFNQFSVRARVGGKQPLLIGQEQ